MGSEMCIRDSVSAMRSAAHRISETPSVVRMPVMYVRIVSVRMNELLVAMSMRVRFRIGHGRIARNMHMLMMLVVHVRMIVLHRFVADPLFRGIRVRPLDLDHVRTVPNLSLLADASRTLDVLVTSKELPAIAALAAAVPNLRIMIDHLASVRIGDRADEANWAAGMQLFSNLANVYCKISAFMEGSTTQPPPTESRFYAGIFSKAEEIFGSDRLVFGSNWPPCLQAGDYSTAVNIAQSYFSRRDPDRTTRIFARNAAEFYRGPRMTQWL